MTDDEQAENDGANTVPPPQQINTGQQHRPAQDGQQAVRNGVMLEDQRGHGSRAGNDAHALDAEQQQGRPQQIEKLRGEKQGAQRDFRGN